MPSSNTNTLYRLMLKISVKLMLTLGMVFLLIVFYNYLFSSQQTRQQQEILELPLENLIPGEMHTLDWNGRQVFVFRRDTSMIKALQQPNTGLFDAHSRHSRQPQATRNQTRSIQADYFIALDYGTDLSCPLTYIPAEARTTVSPWWGGFRDRCRGSWYDLAGRVYKGQQAKRNLEVPVYSIKGNVLNLGNHPINKQTP
ncbi:MAG: hypothetical protein KAJ19_02550 [Gammaproteobacteria bacterium]|nr:hypothetical protein [Gammaproteobacteria bacterium]